MRVAIFGSRKITDKDFVFKELSKFLINRIDTSPFVTFISGGAEGVASISKEYSKANNIDHIMILPYHKVDNKVDFTPRFFFARTRQIIPNADVVFVIDDGTDKDTTYAVEYAKIKEKELYIINYKEGASV